MRLSFDSIEEVKEFVTQLKGTRGKKGDGDEATTGGAPAPIQPPAGGVAGFPGAGGATFAPPGGGAAPGAFPAPGAGPSPEVAAIVQRINVRLDGAIAAGQPAEQATAWLRGQCGPEAANATLDQLKTVFLPKAAMPTLENIAKLMNA